MLFSRPQAQDCMVTAPIGGYHVSLHLCRTMYVGNAELPDTLIMPCQCSTA